MRIHNYDDKRENEDSVSDMSWRDARDWIKQKYPKPSNWLRVDDVWNCGKSNDAHTTSTATAAEAIRVRADINQMNNNEAIRLVLFT